jgi:hypothetical protein
MAGQARFLPHRNVREREAAYRAGWDGYLQRETSYSRMTRSYEFIEREYDPFAIPLHTGLLLCEEAPVDCPMLCRVGLIFSDYV